MSICVCVSDLEALRSFQNQIAAIQRDAVWWLHSVVPTISKVGPKDYVHWYVPKYIGWFTQQHYGCRFLLSELVIESSLKMFSKVAQHCIDFLS